MKVAFITGNSWRHEEAKKLLSGIDVEWRRLTLDRGAGETLEEISTARVLDGFRQLKAPCFVENTGLYLERHDGQPGRGFKKLLMELGEEGFAKRFGASRGLSRVVLAYTADGEQVHLFEGQSGGLLIDSPRGEGGYGWDRLWIPDGFQRTLAELKEAKFIVNMRQRPFAELNAHLRGDGQLAMFESHVTVAPTTRLAEFARSCDRLGVKCLHIVMPEHTAQAEQPMTAAHHTGTFAEAMRTVTGLAEELVHDGFAVTRVKLEAVGRHRDVPSTDDEAKATSRQRYFEHHATVKLPAGFDESKLEAVCARLGAYVSRNALKPADVRFLTLRQYEVGQATADARFEAVIDLVREHGLTLVNRAREYTVYDSAIEIDAGWRG
ncbi:MAG: hypothetical protein JNK82_12495 [Myxococcaceae bacterium]|nr:hypothetical protein [Myxococcaceae bacterium]